MMLPTLIASSVIRGSHVGDSHGGLYLIDLERDRVELKLDWNSTDIDVAGRGGDRGLRGIAFHKQSVLVAANAEILVFDRELRRHDTYKNSYLAHCHEIATLGSRLFITSTGFDSILMFDLERRRFLVGFHFEMQSNRQLSLRTFDPNSSAGPTATRELHLNSVTASDRGVFFSGVRLAGLWRLSERSVAQLAIHPPGTHNSQLLNGGLLYNDTQSDRVCYWTRGAVRTMNVPVFPTEVIENPDGLSPTVARVGFARGLCAFDAATIAGGSSPSTVSVYDLESTRRLKQINLSMDIRNAIHGLEVWPFAN